MAITRDHAGARPGRLPLPPAAAVFVLWNLATLRRCARRRPRSATRAPTASTPRSAAPFLALLWPRLRDRAQPGGGACSAPPSRCAWCRSTPAGVPVLAAGVVALGMGLLTRDAVDPTELPSEGDLP